MSAVPKCRSALIGGELYPAALRCAHTQQVHETCSPSGRTTTAHRATTVPQVCPVDEALRPPSQRSEGFHGRLRPVAAVSGAEAAAAAVGAGCVAAASRDCAGMQQLALRCNRLRCDAPGGAVLQQIALRCSGWCNRQRCDATRSACPVGPTLGVL